MNKKFYFALALTAGLFASCSSDDLTSQAPAGPNVNDNDQALISIAVENPGVTRGTGTVGGTTDATNVWAGQTFNLFMFEKGTFNPAQKTVAGSPVDIYNNAVMTTPDDGIHTAASYVIGTEEQFNYYPTTGAYSFWAYRVDDAGTGTAGAGDPVGVGDATATEVTIPFTIDGSQDILTAIPDEAGDLADLQNGNALKGVTAASTATADQIYTAYSSRRGVTPTLQFKHQLTRLTFQVKPATQEVSAAAKSVGAGASYNGFKVTGISVKSKSTGNIIAAWKSGSTYSAQGVVFNSATEDWADPTTLAAMPLKSRGKTVLQKQEGDWSELITVSISAAGVATYGQAYSLGADGFYAAAETVVYPANTENSYTGVPNTTQTTLGALVAAYKDANEDATNPGTYTAGSVTGYAYRVKTGKDLVLDVTTNAAANLVDLEEVIPHWTYTWAAYTPQAIYHWEEVATAPAGGNDVSATVTAVPDESTAGAVNDYTIVGGKTYALTSIGYDTDGCREIAAAPVDSDPTATPVVYGTPGYAGELVKETGTTNYFKCTLGASGQKTDVGEALLVAPGAPGYEMTVTYKRWKKTSTSVYSEIDGSVTKTISRTGNAAFKAGESYNIVVTLYKDGDASTNTNITPWTSSSDGDINIEGEE